MPWSILLATPRFAPQRGGAETWTRGIASRLVERGHHLVVVTRRVAGIPVASVVDGVHVRRTARGRVGFSVAIATAVRGDRPDVVLAQYSALPPAVMAARRGGVPVLGIVHDVYGARESRRIKGPVVGTARYLALEASLRWLQPDAFLAPSGATATRLARIAPDRRVTVVPAGADHLVGGPPSAPRPGRVVFVGRLVPQKGVRDLVAAVRSLRDRGRSEVHAVVIGDGPERQPLERETADMAGAVRFLGAVDDAALADALASASALALPSTREGWALAITEAAARGVPYVAYDVPAVREQHERLGGGFVVPANPGALAEALDRILLDRALAERLGAAAREAVRPMTWARAAEVVEGAIAALIGG